MMSRFSGSALRAWIALGIAALAAGIARTGSAAVKVAPLKAPDGGIQPQAAVDASGTLHVVYLKGDSGSADVFYVRRPAGASAFSSPLRVNSSPKSAIATGTIRGASVALGRNGRVHVAWNGSSQAKPRGPLNPFMPADSPYNGTPLLYTRLNDAGTAFEPQRNLMRSTFGLDGGTTVAADPLGNVFVFWHAQSGANRGEELRRPWLARSADDGKTFTAEAPVWSEPTGACGCCQTRIFADKKGTVYAFYRAATERTRRDMVLLASHDHGVKWDLSRIHPWEIDACPMSSESFAEGPQGVIAAWETKGQVYLARVLPGGTKVSAPIPAPGTGDKRKHPTLAINARGETLLAWTEGTGWQRGGNLLWQVYDRDLHPTSDRGRIDGGIPVWGIDSAAALPDGSFVIVH